VWLCSIKGIEIARYSIKCTGSSDAPRLVKFSIIKRYSTHFFLNKKNTTMKTDVIGELCWFASQKGKDALFNLLNNYYLAKQNVESNMFSVNGIIESNWRKINLISFLRHSDYNCLANFNNSQIKAIFIDSELWVKKYRSAKKSSFLVFVEKNEELKKFNKNSIDTFVSDFLQLQNDFISIDSVVEYINEYPAQNYLDSEIEIASQKIFSEIGIKIEKRFETVKFYFETHLTNILFHRLLNDECRTGEDAPF